MPLMNADAERDAFAEALDAADKLNGALGPLRVNEERAVERLRTELSRPGQEVQVMFLLTALDPEPTKALVDDLLDHALREGYTLQIRHLLGRLEWSEAREIVPPAVWRLLADTDDSDDYRRMAELLDHLGLNEALHELCTRARESGDEEMRSVAEDFE